MTTRAQQDARHREAVRTYYESGNEALLGPVLAELRPRLVSFLAGKGLRDTWQAEDLVQESLAVALIDLRVHKFAFAGTVAAWAVGICWHRFLDSTQRKKHQPSQPGAEEDPFLLLAAALATPAEVLSVQREEEYRAGAVVEAITHAVLGLDPNARACVLLTYYQGLPEATAAARLGIEEAKFRARLRRGLAGLRAWGTRHQHLAPEPDVYAALLRTDSGDLFREPLRMVG
jgi:RNA polymerase sigma factor (sigma-70 family)